jgi:regulatory protein
VRRILWRRAERSLAEHGGDREAVTRWIDEAVARARGHGWIDDQRLADDLVASMRRRGASARGARARLHAKGLPAELVAEALQDEPPDAELRAAAAYARRRALGPWRRAPADREARAKELARLGRAGFSYEVARQVVEAERAEDLPER